jgi:HPt (histidine-containing phosphotransfer) domain-containing protein
VKNTIWSKILLFVALPLILFLLIGSFFIIRFVLDDKIGDVETEVRNLARFNEVSFQGYIDTVKLAVVTAAADLADIDPARPDARIRGEQILLTSLRNSAAHNAWLIFEPDAFDGRDAEHRGEYPGEQSGRYMRSYVRWENGYVEAPDMDETLLDDMELSYWYLVPKQRRVPFLDIAVDYAFSWDYGIGEGNVNTISLVVPIFRGGVFIGCVGHDIQVTGEMLGSEMVDGAVSALFTSTGILRYHTKTENVGKSLEELGFPGAARIEAALARREGLALSGEYCPLLEAGAFSYFQPVELAGFNELVYVYAAVPESEIRKAMTPVVISVFCTLGVSLLICFLLLLYFFRRVSKPVHQLILACDAISRGNFDTKISTLNNFRNEIGVMTQSLYRMVEQFMMHITMRERSEKLLDMYTRLHRALYRHGRMEDVFDEIMAVIGDFFSLRRALLVLTAGESARISAVFEPGGGARKAEGEGEKFLYHRQITALMAGKKYLSLNAQALREQKVSFAGSQVLYLCVFPLLAANELRGYVIMEGDDETGPIIHNDAALLFLSETVSFMLTQRENAALPSLPAAPRNPLPPGSDPPEEEELPVIKAARAIEDLDVDQGLLHSGGLEEQYGDLLRISAKSFTAKAKTMRSLCTADLPAFGIEVHGIKGALNAIGAARLGNQAKELEFAAKGGDAEFCAREYPAFEEKLTLFAARLGAIAKKKDIPRGGPGAIPALITGLEKALEASRLFDSSRAVEELHSLLAYSWEDAGDAGGNPVGDPGDPVGEVLERIVDSLEYMDYDGAEREMGLLLERFGPGKAPNPEPGAP